MIKFDEVAKQVSILRAAEFCGLTVKQYRSPCPACNQGGERALQFFTDTERFKCWAYEGKMWGDSVQLVSHVKGVRQGEAAAMLVSHFSLKVDNEKAPEKPKTAPQGFDPAKYRSTLITEHELLSGIPPELCESAGIGVAPKGAHQGKVVVPLFNQAGEFLVYASVTGLTLPKNWRPK